MTAKRLVVEDDRANMKLTTMLLEHAGYRVLRADNATDGIVLAAEQAPDLILMDIRLPGMDGLEAKRRSRVVAPTACAMENDEARILAAGCDAYIPKTIEYKEFLAKAAELLAGEMDKGMA